LNEPEDDEAGESKIGEDTEDVASEEEPQDDVVDDAAEVEVIDIEEKAGTSNSTATLPESTILANGPRESDTNGKLQGGMDSSSTARRRKRAARRILCKSTSKHFF